jgi:hypothetical protein
MRSNLTSDLREGSRHSERALTPEQRGLLARARDTTTVALPERNRTLAQIVAAYRLGHRQLWGGILLDLAAPALLEVLQRFQARYAVLDEEDVSQQLVVQYLHSVATMRIPHDGRGLRRKLVSRAAKATARRLGRERRHQSWHYSFETHGEKGE